MRLKTLIFYMVTTITLLVTAFGCGGSPEEAPTPKRAPVAANDDWQISGRLTTPGFSNGEMVAIGMDGKRFGTEIDENSNFDLPLPGKQSYAVYFFPPSHLKQPNVVQASEFIDGALGPDLSREGWAMLHFQDSPEFGMRDTLRLPKPGSDHHLDFGAIDIKGSRAIPSNNPASKLDYDWDGINDAADPDDQNDGKNDREQKNDLERVTICHYTSNDSGTMKSIPLSLLLTHLVQGDTVGTCTKSKRPATNSSMQGKGLNVPDKMPADAKLPVSEGPEKPGHQRSTEPLINPSVVIEETPDDEPQEMDMGKDEESDASENDMDEKKDHARNRMENEPEADEDADDISEDDHIHGDNERDDSERERKPKKKTGDKNRKKKR